MKTTISPLRQRMSEVAGLMVADIDSGRGVIRIRHGTGAKDRQVMLSVQLLHILRDYWRLARPKDWLFPGRDGSGPINMTVLHAACRGDRQAGDRAYAASCLRHASVGERHRYCERSWFRTGFDELRRRLRTAADAPLIRKKLVVPSRLRCRVVYP